MTPSITSVPHHLEQGEATERSCAIPLTRRLGIHGQPGGSLPLRRVTPVEKVVHPQDDTSCDA